ncbi:MarR family winged helix-turn-helix transcriptional regulator [uncultured Pseudokineococcus sp.]|uniref:MarR family winged helix-turn-helix transcriptional regulator n=1 Tax=uncultured Pseudokineococcus sp. TaxID=1642928 RepID=UPI00263A1E7D|nr:MarR family transcriptional regulator [uncultured Pseudokineococcus sp.]
MGEQRPGAREDAAGVTGDDARASTLRVLQALQRVTTETDRYVEQVGAAHATARTDLSAVAAVVEAEGRGDEHSPGSLGRHLNLSSPATSALLDRLERAGHVRRVRSTTDRRRVVVEVTDTARDLGRSVFTPLASELAGVLDGYDAQERALLERFLGEAGDAIDRSRRRGARRGS